MKILKRLAAAVAVIAVLSSCSVIKNVANTASTYGLNTGSGLSALYKVLQATGAIDLSNVTNLINLGKILTGANSLTGASSSFLDAFSSGLINGSNRLVNNSNLSGVLGGLRALANIDTSAITNASTVATKGDTAPQLTNSTAGVAPTLSELNSIFSLFK